MASKHKLCSRCRYFSGPFCTHPAANTDALTGQPVIYANVFRAYGLCTLRGTYWKPRTLRQRFRKLIRRLTGL